MEGMSPVAQANMIATRTARMVVTTILLELILKKTIAWVNEDEEMNGGEQIASTKSAELKTTNASNNN